MYTPPNIFLPADQQRIDDIPLEEDRGTCDFCQEPIKDDEEERYITAGDEGLTLCASCGEHYLD
jgi:hydrogenase maturation factor HypF (carbamoyltransferase family)